VRDDHLVRHRGRQRESLRGLRADQVLHRHRFAHAQQRAIEDGMRAHGLVRAQVGRHVEAPRFDATIPVGHHERHIGLAARLRMVRRNARRHEVAVHAVGAILVAAIGQLCEARDAGGIGRAFAQQFAIAAAHGHLGIGHGLAVVERGDPRQTAHVAIGRHAPA
jgi:hypothetical protein